MNQSLEQIQSHPQADDRSSEEASFPTPPSLQKQYQFIKEIGHGAQGTVFRAKRLADNQEVVVKQLNIGSVKNWKEYELFQREAAVLKSLDIDGVARFYDAIDCLEDTPPCSYIIQEYIEGSTLAQQLKSGHRLKVNDVYDIIIQMLNILMKLHSQNPPVIHRDIKPSNIILTPCKNGAPKVTIIDFGAVANPKVQSGGSTVAGTYGYMPPEQLMGKPEPASDIYALAAVAVEMFTGKSPATLPTKDFRLIFEPEMEQMPPNLVNTLRKMLAPNVKDRLTDIHALVDKFTQFKENNYIALAKENSVNYPKDYNQRLLDVASVGESGNMDIWQELPDAVPRTAPHAYDTLTKQSQNNHTSSKKINSNLYKISSLSCFMTMLYFSALVLCMGLSIIHPVMFIFGVFFFLILCFSFYKKTKPYNLCFGQSSEYYYYDELTESIRFNPSMLLHLIMDGRKTVATITSIEWLPLDQSKAKYLPHNKICFCNDLPAFKITYKFNPPDDAREEDLYHEYVMHYDPNFECKVGDPLPILYLIEGSDGSETVTSMPFPFPIESADCNEVLFQTRCEKS